MIWRLQSPSKDVHLDNPETIRLASIFPARRDRLNTPGTEAMSSFLEKVLFVSGGGVQFFFLWGGRRRRGSGGSILGDLGVEILKITDNQNVLGKVGGWGRGSLLQVLSGVQSLDIGSRVPTEPSA